MNTSVSGLFVYPIKSCGAVSLTQASLEASGLAGDRRYMLVDASGKFITQRTHAKLALVRLSEAGDDFTANAPGRPALEVPRALAHGAELPVTVWKDQTTALVHEAGSAWFSAFLASEVRLVYLPESGLRQVNPERAQPGDRVGFADGYPILLTNEASLEALSDAIAERTGERHGVPMNRFRPNIVVRGLAPFAEDHLGELSIGGLPFVMAKACDRCVVTTTDQTTGEREREPLATLATFRRWDGAVWFGVNLIHRASGTLRVGDELVAL